MLGKLLSLFIFITVGSAADAFTLSESWCRLTADDITKVIGKQVRGAGRMTGSVFDAEITNNSKSYTITEIEMEFIGTYNGSRVFKRTSTQSVFLKPEESKRVFFMVDSSFNSDAKLESKTIIKLTGCLVE